MWKQLLVMHFLFVHEQNTLRCPGKADAPQQFHLVRECQRAVTDDALALENTSSLAECINLTQQLRGLALNYAPGGRIRQANYFAHQPENKNGRAREARRRLNVFQQPGSSSTVMCYSVRRIQALPEW